MRNIHGLIKDEKFMIKFFDSKMVGNFTGVKWWLDDDHVVFEAVQIKDRVIIWSLHNTPFSVQDVYEFESKDLARQLNATLKRNKAIKKKRMKI